MAPMISKYARWLVPPVLVVVLHSPRLLALVIGLAAIIPVFHVVSQGATLRLLLHPAAVSMLTFSSYALLSSFWSANVLASLLKPMFLILMTVGIVGSLELSRAACDESLRKWLGWVIVGSIIVFTIAFFEVWSGEYLQRRLFDAAPWLYSGMKKHVFLDDNGRVGRLLDTNIKRRTAMLVLWVWPLALMIRVVFANRLRLLSYSVLLVVTIGAIGMGPHKSSLMALSLSVPVFALASVSAKFTLRILAVACVCIALLSPPIAWGLHRAKLHEAHWLPESARDRVVIWNATATETLKHPLIGVGADATIVENEGYMRAQSGRREGGFVVRIERHAHNIYLQVWYELGAIGALLVAVFFASVLSCFQDLSASTRSFGAAYAAAVAVLVSSSYGLWQMWLQAAIAISTLGFVIAARALARLSPGPLV